MTEFFKDNPDVYCFSRHNYSPANSALVADIMTCLMMCARLRTAPLLFGMVVLFERKKLPPAQLHACGLLR